MDVGVDVAVVVEVAMEVSREALGSREPTMLDTVTAQSAAMTTVAPATT